MLQISKFEMHSGADRNQFGNAAFNLCKAARATPGVVDAKYYWVNANCIGFIIDADPGAWGPGSASTAETAKASFALADVSSQTSNEHWMGAREGTENYNLAQ